MKNSFDSMRLTHGDCSFCLWPIEIYENIHYVYTDKSSLPVHKECVDLAQVIP